MVALSPRSLESTTRRLPGFRFEAQTPSSEAVLPRMDVAVFVGFTASGPLHTPVPVEDVEQFAAIFGADAPPAWDQQRGEQVYAYLAPAVRAFFRNGGRRCWIVRVAGEAQYNTFPLPGLAELNADGEIVPSFARARSQGSWSDPWRTATVLLNQPLVVQTISFAESTIDVAMHAADVVSEGDLLRLTFRDQNCVLLFVVQSVLPLQTTSEHRTNVRVTARHALWFRQVDHSITLEPTIKLDEVPAAGALLPIERNGLLCVRDVNITNDEGSPSQSSVRVSGIAFRRLSSAPENLSGSELVAEKLMLEMWARRGDDDPLRLSNLSFVPGHPRFWGDLPTDDELYANPLFANADERAWSAAQETSWRQSALAAHFPFAGPSEKAVLSFPLGMSFVPQEFLSVIPFNASALERDGLGNFDERLFLDAALRDAGTAGLMAQADFLRYQSPTPRPLRGIHAALQIGEATLIAVPDAIHRGWQYTTQEDQPAAEIVSPPERPEWWHFLECEPPTAYPRVTEPEWGNFLSCAIRVVAAPSLRKSDEPDATGTFTLVWSTQPGARYVLQEAASPSFRDAVVIFTGTDNHITIYGRSAGDYYYHVRAEIDGNISDWSNSVGVRVAPAQQWVLKTASEYSDHTLLAVQRALLRVCAARGDLFAVQALPEHFREDDALTYVAALTSPAAPAVDGVLPLGFGEEDALSYGAVYHPWLLGREENQPDEIRRTPPDGAACGVLARRAIERGAWTAPANEVLRGVVALTPSIGSARWLDLQTAQINLIRQVPRGFMSLSADTLSIDPDLRPISVRRLLMLLRRLALRYGVTYVFEPNSDTFRRLVQRSFELLLEGMFERGAFAGATPDDAFRVVLTGTAQDLEQGRLIVELRVAPSLPLTFLTIRLVQTSDHAAVTEVR